MKEITVRKHERYCVYYMLLKYGFNVLLIKSKKYFNTLYYTMKRFKPIKERYFIKNNVSKWIQSSSWNRNKKLLSLLTHCLELCDISSKEKWKKNKKPCLFTCNCPISIYIVILRRKKIWYFFKLKNYWINFQECYVVTNFTVTYYYVNSREFFYNMT